jgi:hypothetical protein
MKFKETLLAFFGLFTSISTILCCALPTILVAIGMGTVFASITSNFPFVIWLSQKILYLFVTTAILLLVGGYFIFLKPQTCPLNQNSNQICNKTKKFNKIIWWVSFIILITSFFFKYILIHLMSV